MILIYKGRRAGKTTEAIKIANESKGYLIVLNDREKLRIREECKRNPVSFRELTEFGMRGSFVRNIVIDNFDLFLEERLLKSLECLAGLEIDAITFTESPEEIFKRVYGRFIGDQK